MTDSRERLYENLEQCCPEGTRSGSLDHAARFYCKMHGYNDVVPGQGAIGELLDVAIEEGSVTPEQIAAILGTEEYPIELDVDLQHGFDHD